MKRRSTIAVGVDGSWAGNGAVDWALHESELTAAPIRAVHVIDDRPPLGAYFNFPGADAAARALVGEVCAYLDHHDRPGLHTGLVLCGPPAHTLAGATGGDRMLVVGRQGRSVLGRLLIGSTAEAAAHESRTAVVVVPPRWRPGDPQAPVVVGVDRPDRWAAAVDFAARFAAERDASIQLVHVCKTITHDEAVEDARRRLDEILGRCRDEHPGTTFRPELRRGHPVAALTAAAIEVNAQLLVVGGHPHGRVASTVLSGTAHGVLQHAPCPAAIVHQPERPH
ncbi:universal stress protein [Kribbella sp. NPDC003557]|uniref:universal stress protein n=1 Tax=Kribbella sp. NPDC003557 TaxID=3154449 RepID=UPI00339EFEDA